MGNCLTQANGDLEKVTSSRVVIRVIQRAWKVE
jgi:hypothetical protein